MARSNGMKRGLALLLATVALVAMAAGPASAGPRLHCLANGQVFHSQNADMTWNWQISGAGTCLDGGNGPFAITLQGTGTSDTLGLCSGALVVQNLEIDVQLNIVNLRTGRVFSSAATWSAPISTFPIVTPFLVGGGQSGLGVIATRVLGNCPPGGATVATFVFDTSSNEG